MDIQYRGSFVIRLSDGTMFQEANVRLKNPVEFKRYETHRDENLFLVSNRFYQNTSMWYPIAKFSGVVDPMDIPEGTILLLPVYDDKSPQDIFI